MTRITNSLNAAELQKTAILGCMLVDLDFASGHLYANDGFSECTFAGNVYSPLGQFGGIDAVEEALDTIARPIKLTLSGLDAALVGPAQNEIYQNRSATVYVALIDQQSGRLVANPEIAWEGRMDTMAISIDQNVGRITLNCEHRLRREPRIARYTDVDQQVAHTGDRFFSYTTKIAGFQSQWGNQKMVYGGPSRTPFKYVYQR